MAKKKSKWLSPKKQAALLEKQRKEKRKKISIITTLSIVAVGALAWLTIAIIMASRPYYADIEIEGYGVVSLELHDDEAPKTVEHFVSLAESGFYDGTAFIGIIEDEFIRGGYKENEKADTVKGEFSKNGVNNSLSHTLGKVSMLRETKASGDTNSREEDFYDTATNEFFIMIKDNLKYDTSYAVFATVMQGGMDTIFKICEETEVGEDGMIAKENQPIIKTITIRRG